MTYTFKLARRLSVLRGGAGSLLVALVVACGDAASTAPSDSASPDRPDGPQGPDTAQTPPAPPAGAPASLSVSPSAATLVPGASLRFAAHAVRAGGDSVSLAVAWTSSGGSVTTDGVFTAPDPGRYTVVARALADSALLDSALVTVAAGATPPDSGTTQPPATTPERECDRRRSEWIWCDDFEDDRLAGYFEVQTDGGSFGREAGVGRDGSWGMRGRFAKGQTSAGALHLAFGKTPQETFRPVDDGRTVHREIYWRVWVRHEAGWSGGGGDKLSRVISFASPTSWAQAMKGAVWSGGSDTNRDYLMIEPISGTDEEGNLKSTGYNDYPNQRYLGARAGKTPIFDAAHVGAWYCVEARVRLNDPGAANGSFQLWIDGSLEAERHDLNWVGAFQEYGLNAVFLENYWNAGSPKAQTRDFDGFVVSTARIGC